MEENSKMKLMGCVVIIGLFQIKTGNILLL